MTVRKKSGKRDMREKRQEGERIILKCEYICNV
jgi:hypothetical protein